MVGKAVDGGKSRRRSEIITQCLTTMTTAGTTSAAVAAMYNTIIEICSILRGNLIYSIKRGKRSGGSKTCVSTLSTVLSTKEG